MPEDDPLLEKPRVADGSDPARGPEPDGDGGGARGEGRGWKIAAVIAVLAAMVALGALGSLLFAGPGGGTDKPAANVRACIPSRDFRSGSSDDGDDCPPKGATRLDGMVTRTDEGGFTIQVIEDGQLGQERRLHVRAPDRPYIDIAHAQTHAALGQPIRVYLQEIDGRESVVYMEDAPLVR